MELNIMAISKIGLGFFLGVCVGALLKYFLIRALIIAGIPALVLFFLDYIGYRVDWLMLDGKWRVHVLPPIMAVYYYFSHHMLAGVIPGLIVGLSISFFLSKRFV